jgi:hypothetical protein
MNNKARTGGIIALIVLLGLYLLYKYRAPILAVGVKVNGQPVPSTAYYPNATNVKARAMGQAIKVADPTSPTGYSWMAPVGAHVEQATDGTWWIVPNNTPAQNRQGAASGLTTGPQPQSVPYYAPAPGTVYGIGTPGVATGTNTFPPTNNGPSGSQLPNFDQSTAIFDANTYGTESLPTPGGTYAGPQDNSAIAAYNAALSGS